MQSETLYILPDVFDAIISDISVEFNDSCDSYIIIVNKLSPQTSSKQF